MNEQLSQYDHSNQIKISSANPDEIQRSPHKPAAFFSSARNLALILAQKRSIKLQEGQQQVAVRCKWVYVLARDPKEKDEEHSQRGQPATGEAMGSDAGRAVPVRLPAHARSIAGHVPPPQILLRRQEIAGRAAGLQTRTKQTVSEQTRAGARGAGATAATPVRLASGFAPNLTHQLPATHRPRRDGFKKPSI